MARFDLSGCCCAACGSGQLDVAPAVDESSIVASAIRCGACGTSYDVLWGIPFLCAYGEEDLLSLVEMAASVQPDVSADSPRFEQLDALACEYHHAQDGDEVLAAAGGGGWVLNRYNEWLEARTLTAGISLAGLDVLDVGAGRGSDSARLLREGARVTALEISPVLAREGAKALAGVRWIGGSAHALPFQDQSFDMVFCNAAMHHMGDIPQAMGEMLRVLRPGGWLITTCDSFRADTMSEQDELRIFRAEPSVLLGINERVPRLAEYVETLKRERSNLSVQLFTHLVYQGGRRADGTLCDLPYLRQWDFDRQQDHLAKCSGSLALKVRLDTPTSAAGHRRPLGAIRPAQLASSLWNRSDAARDLAALVPQHLVNRPFPAPPARFDLLNGWIPGSTPDRQEAYLRARWYLSRAANVGLAFDVLLPERGRAAAMRVAISVDGTVTAEHEVARGLWTRISLPVDMVPAGQTFALDIELKDCGAKFEDATFQVANRQWLDGAFTPGACSLRVEPAQAGLGALLATEWVGLDRLAILYHPGAGLRAFNRLRASGFRRLSVWVAEGQECVLAVESNVEVIGTYPDPHLGVPANLPFAPDLVVAPTVEAAGELYAALDPGMRKPCWAVLDDGRLLRLDGASLAQAAAGRAAGSQSRALRLLRRLGKAALRRLPLVGALRRCF